MRRVLLLFRILEEFVFRKFKFKNNMNTAMVVVPLPSWMAQHVVPIYSVAVILRSVYTTYIQNLITFCISVNLHINTRDCTLLPFIIQCALSMAIVSFLSYHSSPRVWNPQSRLEMGLFVIFVFTMEYVSIRFLRCLVMSL